MIDGCVQMHSTSTMRATACMRTICLFVLKSNSREMSLAMIARNSYDGSIALYSKTIPILVCVFSLILLLLAIGGNDNDHKYFRADKIQTQNIFSRKLSFSSHLLK